MDELTNPFSPGAGTPPPELVGRKDILEQARVLLERVALRRPERSLLLTGLRGVGKTVLLNEIERMAIERNYHTAIFETMEGQSLGEMLSRPIRGIFFELNRLEGISEKVRRGLIALRNFMGSIKLSYGEFGLDIDPMPGVADSGNIEIDIPDLLISLAEAAKEKKTQIALFIDEIQYVTKQELSALTLAMHRIQQKSLPLILIAAGLPTLPALAGNSKSYAERLFSYPIVGALSREDVARALQEPASREGVRFADESLVQIYHYTKGFPYFLQEWGYQTWKLASSSPISLELVENASLVVKERLDNNFFRVRFNRLTSKEKRFLRAMASFEADAVRSNEPCLLMGFPETSALSTVRANLIKKGMVYSPAHGVLAFTVPLFGEFMRRTIPDIASI